MDQLLDWAARACDAASEAAAEPLMDELLEKTAAAGLRAVAEAWIEALEVEALEVEESVQAPGGSASKALSKASEALASLSRIKATVDGAQADLREARELLMVAGALASLALGAAKVLALAAPALLC